MRTQLVSNAEPAAAIAAFEGAATDLENRSGWGHDGKSLKDVYLQWVHGQLPVLRQHIGISSSEELIHSPFYWHVQTMDTSEPAAGGTLFQGMRHEAVKVRAVAEELQFIAMALRPVDGQQVAVVDTSALAVMQPPWQLPWDKLLDVTPGPVRVVIPLRVVEELDTYKYGDSKHLHDVARALLPQIESRLTEAEGTRAIVNDRLTIEVLILPGPRSRPQHADEEILDSAETIKRFGTQAVTVVADDTSMRVQARARGLRAVGIGTEYRRQRNPSGTNGESEAKGCSADVSQAARGHGLPARR